jgi:hypothetical protein
VMQTQIFEIQVPKGTLIVKVFEILSRNGFQLETQHVLVAKVQTFINFFSDIIEISYDLC